MKRVTTIESPLRLLLAGAAVSLTLAATPPVLAEAPAWNPSASEKLIRLPGNYLKKAVDRDFQQSALAGALNDLDGQITLKQKTLKDLQDAAEVADGEVRTELRHQFLAEKQAFIKMMGERQDLQRKKARTRIKVYQRLLDKLQRQNRGTTPMKAELVANQAQARQRFEAASSQVDLELFGDPMVKQSKYAVEYAKNVAAIESLAQAINSHPMNQQPEIDGEPLSKQDYLRRLIQDTETQVAIIDQEEGILGYMAKLVALDAMALSEDVAEANLGFGDDEEDDASDITSSVAFFIN